MARSEGLLMPFGPSSQAPTFVATLGTNQKVLTFVTDTKKFK